MKNILSFLVKPVILLSVFLSLFSLKGKAYDPVEQDCHSPKTVAVYETLVVSSPVSIIINPVQLNTSTASVKRSGCQITNRALTFNTCRQLSPISTGSQSFCLFKKNALRITYPSSEDDSRLI